MHTSTHTLVKLEISKSAYDEIRDLLLSAGYNHVFISGLEGGIDMSGIAVVVSKGNTTSK